MQGDSRQMRATNLSHNRQSQPRSSHVLATSIKALEHALAIFKGNPCAVIFNLQHRLRRDPQDHIAACGRMRQCVIEQIVQ